MSVIVAENLTRRFGATKALDGFDLRVEAGQILGLIGPNGAGKTTALRAMLGLMRVEGSLQVLDLNPLTSRSRLMQRACYIADVGTLPGWMKVRDLLKFVADTHPGFNPETAQEILAESEVRPTARVKQLSKGMVTQLHLALVMAIDAQLLVLDEPTVGLDILYRQRFYDRILREYHRSESTPEPVTIVISTHEVAEIEHILTHVAFIDAGRVVLTAALADLADEFVQVTVGPDQIEQAKALNPMSVRQGLTGQVAIFRNTPAESIEAFGEVRRPSLADLFVACMGRD